VTLPSTDLQEHTEASSLSDLAAAFRLAPAALRSLDFAEMVATSVLEVEACLSLGGALVPSSRAGPEETSQLATT
jgi:hypothetical protein